MSLADYVAFAEFIVGLGAAFFFAFARTAVVPRSIATALSVAGLALMIWGGFVIWTQKPWQYTETKEEIKIPQSPLPPTFDSIVPPQMAMGTRMHVLQHTPKSIAASYWLSNLGMGSTSDISSSAWAFSNGQLVLLKEEKVAYIGAGDGYEVRNMNAPFAFGKFVICTSYKFKNRKIEQIDFYYNHNQHYSNVPLPKFRDSVFEVDGPSRLCSSMPASARQYI
jgi:hypothetical protein